jgi:hypothetical protein
MPVHPVGKKIVENETGEVVGKSKSPDIAVQASRIRNMAHAAKLGDPAAKKGMKNLKKKKKRSQFDEQENINNRIRM